MNDPLEHLTIKQWFLLLFSVAITVSFYVGYIIGGIE